MNDREYLRNRIVERLDQLDEEALWRLNRWLANGDSSVRPADSGQREPGVVSRRQLLASLVAGGAVLSGTNLATAWYARQQGELAGRQMGANAAQAVMAAETGQTVQELQAEIETLRGLVSHYEALERVNLDQAVSQSMVRFESSMAGVQEQRPLLVEGIDAVRGVLDRFEEAVPIIQQGMAYVDEVVNSLEQRLKALQAVLDDAREVVAGTVDRAAPVADRLGEFFDGLLERIPFGIGERIQSVGLRLREVLEAVPVATLAVRERLLSPLRSNWFAEVAEEGIETALLTPIRTRVLDPAEQLLTDLDDIAGHWQHEVAEPVQRALAERQALHQSLLEYKQRHGLS